MRVISLFTGAGGLDYGFEAAGFETNVALEFDRACCRTLRANRPWPVIEADIHDVDGGELLRIAGLAKGEADVLIGGPPCQPFSKSGYWANGDARRLADQRADTLGAYLRMVASTLPKVILLENVTGLAYRGKDEGLERILRGLEDVNRVAGTRYRPTWAVVNAADYGVPQMRERLVLVASREGAQFSFPAPTHGEGREAWRTAWDALGDLPQHPNDEDARVGGKWAELLPSIPEGQNYLWHTGRGEGRPLFGWRTRYWNFLLKLAKDRPSWTIQAQPGSATGPFHWTSRRLTRRELCRLQTFPDNVEVTGSRNEAQRQIGNAVPSLLAECLARAIAVQLLGHKPFIHEPTLMPPRREPVPRPELVASVPRKYLDLVGHHPDHPGEGLGNRARLRALKAA
jgi:DNA (cytosine-5)-methyltransferase 1